jgi:transcription antitermination factor NusG
MGVVKVIKFGGEVAVIQNDSIQAIKLMIEGGYKPEAIDYFVKGETVKVKSGPLKGLIGEVIRVDNGDRLLVRVDAIQHSISVQIDRGYLKSV